MSAREALMVALRAETKAFRFYTNALRHVSDTKLYELMTELRDAEQEHQALVRAELAKLPPEPGFDPNDYVDEPTAQ
jgi:rubrerythrin